MKKFQKGEVKQKLKDFWDKHYLECIWGATTILGAVWCGYSTCRAYKRGLDDGFDMGSDFGASVICTMLSEKYPKENVDTAVDLLTKLSYDEFDDCFRKVIGVSK